MEWTSLASTRPSPRASGTVSVPTALTSLTIRRCAASTVSSVIAEAAALYHVGLELQVMGDHARIHARCGASR